MTMTTAGQTAFAAADEVLRHRNRDEELETVLSNVSTTTMTTSREDFLSPRHRRNMSAMKTPSRIFQYPP